ncbi:probable LRR receptor-like serine/threonine-protein kinase At4g31250 [Salvia splendens]|uniref:probable LRR receptor-like serine/threonine-protein kinase At4g31250 n=1 Tax=Salvia splendens TaxID=180675 RepID=UPI001C26B1AE|nr:probable LRR receptor-like serine/threonine-protein kinase At4g31250 [Salvia splendens]
MIMSPTTNLYLSILLLSSTASSDDIGIIFDFIINLTNTQTLNWDTVPPPLCVGNSSNWTAVICRNNCIKGLQLENMSLSGTINAPVNLFSLSLANNSFSGPFPADISKLTRLRRLYLSHNNLSGSIPDKAFIGMTALQEVYLANNGFVGKIPSSLIRVQQLSNLSVQNNQFEGKIPDFWQEGNLGLCGAPLSPCPKIWYKKTAFIAATSAAALISILLLLWRRRRTRPLRYQKSVNQFKNEATKTENINAIHNKTEEQGKIQFVRSGRERFELEDLLKAAAEVLGSGSFGSSYKALLLTGKPYVVRSLASHLHGKRKPDQPGLDWPTRLRIVKGVARGLAHLYAEFPSLALPHGHLKSSNVLLDGSFEAVVSDYALAPVINRVTRKTDVWRLGILILEVLTGRFPANYLKKNKDENIDSDFITLSTLDMINKKMDSKFSSKV